MTPATSKSAVVPTSSRRSLVDELLFDQPSQPPKRSSARVRPPDPSRIIFWRIATVEGAIIHPVPGAGPVPMNRLPRQSKRLSWTISVASHDSHAGYHVVRSAARPRCSAGAGGGAIARPVRCHSPVSRAGEFSFFRGRCPWVSASRPRLRRGAPLRSPPRGWGASRTCSPADDGARDEEQGWRGASASFAPAASPRAWWAICCFVTTRAR